MQPETTIRKPNRTNGAGKRPPLPSQTFNQERLRPGGTSVRAEIKDGSLKVESIVQDPSSFATIVIIGAGVSPVTPIDNKEVEDYFRLAAERLCERHQGISLNDNILGGMPHISGMRISVPHILTHLYHLGSVDAVVANFEQRISKEQVKEAIAYAHDFMEMACDPSEDDD
jgi:uncharacterized protein (DUF433 family)